MLQFFQKDGFWVHRISYRLKITFCYNNLRVKSLYVNWYSSFSFWLFLRSWDNCKKKWFYHIKRKNKMVWKVTRLSSISFNCTNLRNEKIVAFLEKTGLNTRQLFSINKSRSSLHWTLFLVFFSFSWCWAFKNFCEFSSRWELEALTV